MGVLTPLPEHMKWFRSVSLTKLNTKIGLQEGHFACLGRFSSESQGIVNTHQLQMGLLGPFLAPEGFLAFLLYVMDVNRTSFVLETTALT